MSGNRPPPLGMRRDSRWRGAVERPRREQGGRPGLAVRPLPRCARGRRPVAQHRRPRARPRQGGRDVGGVPAGTRGARAARLFAGDAKTDERDAMVIAKTALRHPRRAPAVGDPGPTIAAARALAAQRNFLTCENTRNSKPAAQHPAGIVPRLRGAGRPVRRAPAEAHGIPRRGLVGSRRRAPQGGGAHAWGGAR